MEKQTFNYSAEEKKKKVKERKGNITSDMKQIFKMLYGTFYQ